MKPINLITRLIFVSIIISSCKKDEVKLTPLSSINITNAIVNGATAKFGSNAANIANNANTMFGLKVGSNSLYIYPITDSSHPYYNNTVNTNNGDVYSLFLAGTATHVDTLLVKENIPYRTDSTTGIRFINLAPNTLTKPVNITLLATPTVNEVSNLGYKQITDFKSYPALYNSAYTFQIRNDTSAAPKAPLTTFALTSSTVPRFANITLVIRQNGNGLNVFRVNNDR